MIIISRVFFLLFWGVSFYSKSRGSLNVSPVVLDSAIERIRDQNSILHRGKRGINLVWLAGLYASANCRGSHPPATKKCPSKSQALYYRFFITTDSKVKFTRMNLRYPCMNIPIGEGIHTKYVIHPHVVVCRRGYRPRICAPAEKTILNQKAL